VGCGIAGKTPPTTALNEPAASPNHLPQDIIVTGNVLRMSKPLSRGKDWRCGHSNHWRAAPSPIGSTEPSASWREPAHAHGMHCLTSATRCFGKTLTDHLHVPSLCSAHCKSCGFTGPSNDPAMAAGVTTELHGIACLVGWLDVAAPDQSPQDLKKRIIQPDARPCAHTS
jgi:hypothetical protein